MAYDLQLRVGMRAQTRWLTSSLFGISFVVAAACGSEADDAEPASGSKSVPTGDASNASEGGSVSDAANAPDAAFACGSTTCQASQLCVHPCCGGAGTVCSPSDGGACPPGTHAASCDGVPGCEKDPCTPPPPFCVDDAKDPRASSCMPEKGSRDLACICG